jgi:ribonuclease D
MAPADARAVEQTAATTRQDLRIPGSLPCSRYTSPVTRWIRTTRELEALAEILRSCRAVALDSESDSLHHYFEKVCLVQVAPDRGDPCLVDPLQIETLEALAPVIADPAIVKVFHGADYDVTTMKRDFSFRFAGLFDTMIAARFLGIPQFGLQALLKSEFGVELSKARQKDDWSRRPLAPAQEAYALADVTHLLPLHDRFIHRLESCGRLSWVREECDAVAALEPARRRDDPNSYQKMKGARGLSRRSLAALRELAAWREEKAASGDVPAFKILSSETLVALAAALPRDAAAVADFKGLPRALRNDPAPLLQAVARAEAFPESDLPSIRREAAPMVSDTVRRGIARLREWRTAEATRLGLDVSLILPQRLLDRVAERAPRTVADLRDVDGLREWRVEALGAGILQALNP